MVINTVNKATSHALKTSKHLKLITIPTKSSLNKKSSKNNRTHIKYVYISPFTNDSVLQFLICLNFPTMKTDLYHKIEVPHIYKMNEVTKEKIFLHS